LLACLLLVPSEFGLHSFLPPHHYIRHGSQDIATSEIVLPCSCLGDITGRTS
jgi:hypothetical protein